MVVPYKQTATPESVKQAAEEYYGSSNAGWICELITTHYYPGLQLDHAELAMDVNYYFQSFGGLRQLPNQVSASDFNDRALTRANDPQRLQWLWSLGRRLYWSVYDRDPQFWQQQFSDRSPLAKALARTIATIVSVAPQSTPSSRFLMTYFQVSNRSRQPSLPDVQP